jgi:hypothetical protein
MTTEPLAWTGELPRRWAAHGSSILRSRGIDPDRYQSKVVKERLLDAMAVPNILALLEDPRNRGDLDAAEVVERLVLDRGTPNRWLRDAVQPHARMFFGLLVMGLRRESDDVVLPENKRIIWESVRRTLAIIREKELGGPRVPPKRAELACVGSLLRHPGADLLAPGGGDAPPDPKDVDELLEDVARKTRDAIAPERFSAADTVRAIRAWAEPYVLFRLGLLWEWRWIDDDAV